MKNAFSSEEATAAYMDHLEKNDELIKTLRHKMRAPGFAMADRVVAFTNLYHILAGDPYAQRRLVVNLEHFALRQLKLEATE